MSEGLRKGGVETERPIESVEHKVKSKHIYREEGVPDDEKTLDALKEWADAWGEYVWQCKLENQTVPHDEDEASDYLKAKTDMLDEKVRVVKGVLPETKFYSGAVTWDGGHVELSAY